MYFLGNTIPWRTLALIGKSSVRPTWIKSDHLHQKLNLAVNISFLWIQVLFHLLYT